MTSLADAFGGTGEGVARKHPEYVRAEQDWRQVRDCHGGTRTVKARQTTYLPKPGGMTRADYSTYLTRATFIPAVSRTEGVLAGLLFQEPPEVESPTDADALVNDVTGTGQPLEAFAQNWVRELLITGRAALTMDFTDRPTGGMVMPYWRLVSAESLLSWHSVSAMRSPSVLVRATIQDDGWIVDENKNIVLQRRVQEYTIGEDGRVMVRRHVLKDGVWEVAAEIVPTLRGRPLDRLPIIVANWRSVGLSIEPPPLGEIAELSLSHYRSSADREQGNFYASLPTVYVIGAELPDEAEGDGETASKQSFRLGSGKALEIPNEKAEIGYLEIAGPGLASIQKTIEDKKDDLRNAGARLVDSQFRQPETAQTRRANAQQDASLMRLIANTTDQVLGMALRRSLEWMGLDGADASVRINRERLDAGPVEVVNIVDDTGSGSNTGGE